MCNKSHTYRETTNYLPLELTSDGLFSANLAGDVSGDFFDSAVRTEERAATAAALCEPWPALYCLEAGDAED